MTQGLLADAVTLRATGIDTNIFQENTKYANVDHVGGAITYQLLQKIHRKAWPFARLPSPRRSGTWSGSSMYFR